MKEVIIYHDKVYTSSYSIVDKYVSVKRQVGISLSIPLNFYGICYPDLTPTPDIFFDYKTGLIDTKEYEERYYSDVLRYRDPVKVYNDLKGKVMCCWETRRAFCHRHIVLKWIENNLGQECVGGEI